MTRTRTRQGTRQGIRQGTRQGIRQGTVVLLALAAVLLGVPTPASAAYADPLQATKALGLVWHPTPSAALSRLDAALPNVSVNDVVHDTDYPMTSCSSTERAALPIAPAATTSLCWDADRAGSDAWVPQGVTTSGDADDDGRWGADRVLLSGWHGTTQLGSGRYDDARVLFVNANDLSRASFRIAYLAEPDRTGSTFSAAKAHMGGMAWYGDKLFVTAVGNTSTAIRVFSTKHVLRMTSSAATIGATSDGYAAYGYKYAMMEIGSYSYSGGTCSMSSDTGVPCFSSLSLDRSTAPNSLVTTEYFSDQSLHGRLYRFGLGSDYLLSGTTSTQAYRSGVANMQGVLSHNGHWYVAHSSSTTQGQLWDLTTSGGTSSRCTGSSSGSTGACWALHPEALTLDVSTSLVWSLTEYSPADCTAVGQRCGRALFAVPLSSLP